MAPAEAVPIETGPMVLSETHIIPTDDLFYHEESSACPCGPVVGRQAAVPWFGAWIEWVHIFTLSTL